MNRDPSLSSKLSRLRLIEMSSHRIRKEEGQESLQNINEAALRSEEGETQRFIPECRGLRQKEHVGSLPGGPDEEPCPLGNYWGWKLPGVS